MWLTAEQLSKFLDVPVGTIYRWAKEGKWRRTQGRPVYYDAREAIQRDTLRHPEDYSGPC